MFKNTIPDAKTRWDHSAKLDRGNDKTSAIYWTVGHNTVQNNGKHLSLNCKNVRNSPIHVFRNFTYWKQNSLAHSELVVSATRRKTLGDRSFPVAAARAWNALPSALTSSLSLSTFRHSLKTHLFIKSFWLQPEVFHSLYSIILLGFYILMFHFPIVGFYVLN
jgi:hypothetical protein